MIHIYREMIYIYIQREISQKETNQQTTNSSNKNMDASSFCDQDGFGISKDGFTACVNQTIFTLIPFLSLWYVINIKNGEYQDIFYTIMITNWAMGLVVLTFVPFLLRKVFKISFKRLFVF